jgi:diacylglycerol kinase family enzyme
VLDRLFALGPGIRQDDGLLDLCVFSPTHTVGAIRIAWRLFRRDFRTDASALYRSGREFRIECDPPQLYQADGELLGTTPYTIRVEPLAARLLVARRD